MIRLLSDSKTQIMGVCRKHVKMDLAFTGLIQFALQDFLMRKGQMALVYGNLKEGWSIMGILKIMPQKVAFQ